MRHFHDIDTLSQFVGRLPVGIYITSRSGTILDSNRAFLDIFGVSSLEELQRYSSTSLFSDPRQRQCELDILARDGAMRDFEIEIRRPDGERRFLLDTAYQVQDPVDGEILYHGILVDITERKLLEQRLREQAVRDGLTGCYNRHHLAEITAEWERGQDTWGAIVADVDNFKQCNDLHGHDYGDSVLVQISRFLMRQVRAEDRVFRTGGDEFMVLLPGATAEVAQSIVERLRAEGPDAAPVSFSVGWAVREAGEPLERTISRADHNLIRIRVAERKLRRTELP